jgi:hemerythrin superfamily protein/carbon monoxide dehydrogenase subunit G
MTTKVETRITVDAPVDKVYDQWTQFEKFPQFMSGVSSVTQVSDDRVHWVAQIGGVRREWDAKILEQVPDTKVAWAATEGATNAGAVYFQSLGGDRTEVRLALEYEPEGVVETLGDSLGFISRQAESDLERFKAFIESADEPTGAWRGSVNPEAGSGTPGVEDASGTRGDSGKAGVSTKAAVVGAAAVAAGAAVAGAIKHGDSVVGGNTQGRDVVDVLTADHLEVTELLREIAASPDPETRRDVADIVITELVRHSVAEEMYVYPAMREHLPDGQAAVEHDIEEHKEIERVLKKLEGVDAAETQFDTLIASLVTTLQDHIADEESDQFPRLRALMPRETLVALAAKVEAAKKLAPTRPHPAAPNSAPFHKLVGPGVGLVDRLRDKLSGRTAG